VPELQRRGLFHSEYEGETLRENLGLSKPLVERITRTSESKGHWQVHDSGAG